MGKIIVMNLGSTSFKYKLFNEKLEALSTGCVESVGAAQSAYDLRIGEKAISGALLCPTHEDAFALCLNFLMESGALSSIAELDAVGYKAVHCGAVSDAQKVDDALLDKMERFNSFAPAHNPVYIRMMRAMRERYPQLKQAACFETAFHATIPLERAVYGVPFEWVEKYGIRRYGFHGSSHGYMAHRIKEMEPGARRVISIHLGGSSSVCAIEDGRSVANSMGCTPQSGLFQNNRVGDLDVFCLQELADKEGGLEAVMKTLSSKSGLLGISGISNDMRKVMEAAEQGDKRAMLAIDAFTDNIVGYIGMYTAYLNGLDVLVFTGGIGKNSATIRRMVCGRLSWLRLKLDETKNESVWEGKLSREESRVKVYALETNEEWMVVRATMQCWGLG